MCNLLELLNFVTDNKILAAVASMAVHAFLYIAQTRNLARFIIVE